MIHRSLFPTFSFLTQDYLKLKVRKKLDTITFATKTKILFNKVDRIYKLVTMYSGGYINARCYDGPGGTGS
jgi:hypothetical protein